MPPDKVLLHELGSERLCIAGNCPCVGDHTSGFCCRHWEDLKAEGRALSREEDMTAEKYTLVRFDVEHLDQGAVDEVRAIGSVTSVLDDLAPDAVHRVLDCVTDRYKCIFEWGS